VKCVQSPACCLELPVPSGSWSRLSVKIGVSAGVLSSRCLCVWRDACASLNRRGVAGRRSAAPRSIWGLHLARTLGDADPDRGITLEQDIHLAAGRAGLPLLGPPSGA
jgi:hypothetical protein